jgi:hypothetical protein
LSGTRFRPVGQAAEIRFEPQAAGGMRMINTPDSGAKPAVFERAEEFKPTPAQLAEYAGEYRSDEIEPVYRMAVRDGKLFLDRLKSAPASLEPAIKDLFTGSQANIRFVRDPRGRVSGFILNRGRILGFRFRKTPAPEK